jgi:hypothetical protein
VRYAVGLLIALLASGTLAAQGLSVEARLADGGTIDGQLSLDPQRGLQFRSARKYDLASVSAFRSTSRAKASRLSTALLRLRIHHSETITGTITRGDAEKLMLRTSWSDTIETPMAFVEWITHPEGWQLIFFDSFEKESADWKLAGKPQSATGDSTSGERCLVLDGPGQQASYKLPEALASGKIGMTLRQPGQVRGRRWLLELEFANGKQDTRIFGIEVAGPGEEFQVSSAVKPEYRGAVRRSANWRRLCVEFSASTCRALIDDEVLWSQAEGPGGQLRACRLRCESDPGATSGEARFDDFALHAAVPKRAVPAVDLTQDVVFARDGDALFGQITKISSEGIDLETKFGKSRHNWMETAAVSFRRRSVAAVATDGEHVRLTLRAGDGLRDTLSGTVKALDAKRLVLSHPVMGDLAIPVGTIDEIRPDFFGRRLVLDTAVHHLGKQTRSAFVAPKPEGLLLTRRFRLDRVDGDAILAIEAGHVVGGSDGHDISAALKRGGMQTAIFVNDRRAGCLNDQSDRAAAAPSDFRLVIPKELQAIGENTVEIRQTVDSETGRVADCEIYSIRLELPRPR